MDVTKCEAVLERICQDIGGDWLLLGGAFVQMAYDPIRLTEDIDLIPLRHPLKSRDELRDELYDLLREDWNLAPVSVNFSVEFFLRPLKGWEKQLVPFKRGPAGAILQPSLSLFCALKLRRGSPLDLKDVRKALAYRRGHALDLNVMKTWLTQDQLQALIDLLPREYPGIDHSI